MATNIKEISNYITPKTCGIIWLTDDFIDYKTPGLFELNYLLNGIILKSIEKTKTFHRSHYFLGKNFGNPLYIGHVIVKEKSDLDTIYVHIDMSKSLFSESKQIYIYNRSKNTAYTNILKILTKKYPQYEFDNLNI